MRITSFSSPSFFITLLVILTSPALNYSQKSADSSSYFYYRALQPKSENDLIQAFKYYDGLVESYIEDNKNLPAVQSLRMLAIVNYNMGFYRQSEDNAVKGLELLDKLPNDSTTKEARKGFYNQLGNVYRNLNFPEVSLQYYDKALLHAANLKDSLTIFNNQANIHRDVKDYKKSKELYSYVIDRAKMTKDSILIAQALDNFGYVQFLADEANAILNMNHAKDLRLKIKDIKGLYPSYFHLSEYYKKHGPIDSAKHFAVLAYGISDSINSSSYKEDALRRLLVLNQDFEVSEYIKLSDSLSKAKQAQNNAFASMRYNFDKEKSRADRIELEKAKEEREKLMYQGIGFLLLVSGIFSVLYFNSKHKKDRIKQVLNTEARIAKKVHDEVANDMYQIMTKLQSEKASEDVLDHMETVYYKTRDISNENSAIDNTENFDDLLNDLIWSYKSDETNIIIKGLSDMNWDNFSDIKRSTVYRVIQELLTNMRKHSKASIVVLNFKKEGRFKTLEYKDNGIGCELKKKNGLLNTENRIHAINGSITFKTQINEGFNAIIRV